MIESVEIEIGPIGAGRLIVTGSGVTVTGSTGASVGRQGRSE